MINQFAKDYSDQPVVFIDYRYSMSTPPDYPTPEFRWEIIRATEEGLGLTWAVVDSGRMYNRGAETTEEAVEAFTEMLESSLARPAEAEIHAQWERAGDSVNVIATVKNTSTITLSMANNAAVHAIVKEPNIERPHHTTLNPGINTGRAKIETLAPGETGTFYVTVPNLDPEDWDNIQVVVLVDYQVEPGSHYDQLQAQFAQESDQISEISAQPNHFNHSFDKFDNLNVSFTSTILGEQDIEWTATSDRSWLTIDRNSGQTGDQIKLTVNPETLVEGWQTATVTVVDESGTSHTGITVTIYRYNDEYEVKNRIYLPSVLRP